MCRLHKSIVKGEIKIKILRKVKIAMKNLIERLKEVLNSANDLKAQVTELNKVIVAKDEEIDGLEAMLNNSEEDFILVYAKYQSAELELNEVKQELENLKAGLSEGTEELANKAGDIDSLIQESIKFEEEIKRLNDEILTKENEDKENIESLEQVVTELEAVFVEENKEEE